MVEVVIVGFGPVGQALAALLGDAGHHVEVFERRDEVYALPRAVHFDGEAMRLFDQLGIVGDIEHDVLATSGGAFMDGDGEVLVRIDMSGTAAGGWANDYGFYQPVLEEALSAKVATLGSVTVDRGWEAIGLVQRSDRVDVTLRAVAEGDQPASEAATRTASARFVIGADGARSAIRTAAGIALTDLGHTGRWLVADVRPHDMATVAHLPELGGHLDPARPFVAVPNGSRHRRWEFMLLDGERDEDYADPARVWDLLSPHISPDDATLVRHTVYNFRSESADAMQVGRVFLAGDAAHVMPPFAAQGLCCGLRDAACLAWKLDLVLRGVCDESLLTTYEPDRRPQNEAAIQMSKVNAQMATITDPAAAAARDEALRGMGTIPFVVLPPIGPGVLASGTDGAPDPIAGHLAVQGRVASGGQEDLFDRVLGPGFALVCRSVDPASVLDEEQLRFLADIGASIATLGPDAETSVRDVDGALTQWLTANAIEAAISRPDGYAFGAARSAGELPELVDQLRVSLQYQPSESAAVATGTPTERS